MSYLPSVSVQNDTDSKNNQWLMAVVSVLTFFFIALTIYVDVVTGLGNAVTPHEKDVMRFLGLLLGLFASVSIVLTTVLLKNGEYIKAGLAGLLALFLNIYHLSVWMAFFAGIGVHYSKNEFQNSLAYRAQKTTLEILSNSNSVAVNSKEVEVGRIVQLKNAITNEELAMKKCNRLLGWRKVRDCKNEHERRSELANNELSTLLSAQQYHSESAKQQLEKVAALKELEEEAKKPHKTLLPLFETISENTEEGLKYQRYFAYLLAVIAILITDGGFFLVGGLISRKLHLTVSAAKQSKTSTKSTGETTKSSKAKPDEAEVTLTAQKPTILAAQAAEATKTELWDLFKSNYEKRATAETARKTSANPRSSKTAKTVAV